MIIRRTISRRLFGTAVTAGALGLSACGSEPQPPGAAAVVGGEPAAGRLAIRQAGCPACHIIPGVDGPRGMVGPSLEGFAGRGLIAGKVPNRPDLLTGFVRNAPAYDADIAMPPMPLSEQQARDVAAYLYTLE